MISRRKNYSRGARLRKPRLPYMYHPGAPKPSRGAGQLPASVALLFPFPAPLHQAAASRGCDMMISRKENSSRGADVSARTYLVAPFSHMLPISTHPFPSPTIPSQTLHCTLLPPLPLASDMGASARALRRFVRASAARHANRPAPPILLPSSLPPYLSVPSLLTLPLTAPDPKGTEASALALTRTWSSLCCTSFPPVAHPFPSPTPAPYRLLHPLLQVWGRQHSHLRGLGRTSLARPSHGTRRRHLGSGSALMLPRLRFAGERPRSAAAALSRLWCCRFF